LLTGNVTNGLKNISGLIYRVIVEEWKWARVKLFDGATHGRYQMLNVSVFMGRSFTKPILQM
jgi:hypothetical protein